MSWVILFLAAVLCALGLWDFLKSRDLKWAFVIPPKPKASHTPEFTCLLDHKTALGCSHASAFVPTAQGLDVVWFEGSREAAPDVKIHKAEVFSHSAGLISHSRPTAWFGPAELTAKMRPAQAVRVVGNTIGAFPDQPGSFLATIVSVGGWAGSSLALGKVDQDGIISVQRVLSNANTNRSHLARSSTRTFVGGDLLVPAYFEARHAFGELLRLSPSGHVVARARIGHGRQLVQPSLHILDEKRAFALCRRFDDQPNLYRSDTLDGGKSWSEPIQTHIPCPGSPVALLGLTGGRILMAHNPKPIGTDTLCLSISQDEGKTWQVIWDYQDQMPRASLRYPDLALTQAGHIVLSVSAGGKKAILAWGFNEAWISERTKQ